MRYVIHGDDIVSSRNHLNNLKSHYEESVYLDGKGLALADYNEIISKQPLFRKNLVFIVEGYNGSDKIFEFPAQFDTIFWWAATLKKTPPNSRVFHFNSQSAFGIFKYADSVGNKQVKPALDLLYKLFDNRIPREKIVTILARQLRMIAQTLEGDVDKVSSSDFVRKKLAQQAKHWDLRQVQESLSLLFLVDLRLKRGETKPESALTFLTHRLCKN